MADVGNLLVGIGAIGAVIVSAVGLRRRDTTEDDTTYWRRRALDCEASRGDDAPVRQRRRVRKDTR